MTNTPANFSTLTTMELYNVEVTYRVVIRAESQQAADRRADYIVRREDDGEPITVISTEVKKLADLEAPWDGNCRPWGERDPFDRTIGEILANAKSSDAERLL